MSLQYQTIQLLVFQNFLYMLALQNILLNNFLIIHKKIYASLIINVWLQEEKSHSFFIAILFQSRQIRNMRKILRNIGTLTR